MSDISAIAARHAEDESAGPFVGRRSEQARLDRATLLQEIARLREAINVIAACLSEMMTRLEEQCQPLHVIVKEVGRE